MQLHQASRLWAALLVVCGSSVTVAGAAPQCTPVTGAFAFTAFTFTGPTTATAEATISGDLAGTVTAEYFDLHQSGEGATHGHAVHMITTATGTLVTMDEIMLLPPTDPDVSRPHSRLYIAGGTGAYQGATGLLKTQGEVDLSSLEGSIPFKGRVCLP
jgi:hypothetical protein